MQNRKPKLTSDEDEVRSQKSHYTNVSKQESFPTNNVELSLEVELDDEVRNIIKNPEKCASALLDVTVIKPKGLDQFSSKTQTLKTDQVKKLIECMQLENTDKKKLMEKLFGLSDIAETDDKHQRVRKEHKKKSCLSHKSKHLYRQSSMELDQGDVQCLTDENNTAVFSMYDQKRQAKEADSDSKSQPVQQIYTSPRTHENIREMFACKNKRPGGNHNGKMDQPCLCQNCAIVGILTDSQKKPFATEPMVNPIEEETKYRRPSRKKSVTFKRLDDVPNPNISHEQCQAIFKILSSRISELEKRILMQEERAVPKDYFKKIITKLVNHLSRLTHYTTEEKHNMTHKDSPEKHKYRSNDRYGPKSNYFINPVLVDSYKFPAEKEYEPKPCSSSEPPRGPTESIWKWGEEVLTTGRDLKNKVVCLLEDTLHNLKRGWEKSSQNYNRCEDDIQTIVDELSKNLAKTVRKSSRSKVRKMSPEKSTAATSAKHKSRPERKPGKPSMIPRYTRRQGPAVNVAYVNPDMTRWPEESLVSFKIDTSDYDSHREQNMSEAKKKQYKKEFLKVLENTKKADKYKLWQNIWNQALENRQTKNNTVTIQIPDPNDLLRQKMIHLEYTIGDLEQLLLPNQSHPNTNR